MGVLRESSALQLLVPNDEDTDSTVYEMTDEEVTPVEHWEDLDRPPPNNLQALRVGPSPEEQAEMAEGERQARMAKPTHEFGLITLAGQRHAMHATDTPARLS
jgi:hypothetical protein